MSDINNYNKKGFSNPYTSTSQFNANDFQIKQAIRKINTAFLARIDSCSSQGVAGSGHVSATPLTTQIDGLGNAVPATVLPHLPFYRLQQGIGAVILDPVPGDIGVFVCCKSDISNIDKNTKSSQRPGSFREFDQSDSVMVGTIHTQAPQVYIHIKQDKTILIHAPQGLKIETDADVEIVAKGNLTANVSGKAELIANGSVSITSPQTTINGPLTVTGAIVGQGGLAVSGGSGASVSGSLTTTGDVIANSISLDNHTHSGVEPGAGNTGGPQ